MASILKMLLIVCALSGFSLSAYAQTKVVVIPMAGDEPAKEKVIFITKGKYSGNFGGLRGADAICQADADALGSKVKGKKFKAWLGPATDPLAGERQFIVHDIPYITPNGDVYVQSYSTLLTLIPWPFLSIAADGIAITSPTEYDDVWTGRSTEGVSLVNCGSWFSSSTTGAGAVFFEVSRGESAYSPVIEDQMSCDAASGSIPRIICMEQ